MTAIAGLWRFDGRPDAAEGCTRMLAAQKIYGPDHGAQWSDSAVALGRCLMRVLPEDTFDRGPISRGEGRYVLVADVRLDNRDELTEALRISASRARTLCDAAILLAAIERWGESCPEHLVGDYAFAAWDSTQRQFLLARDPLGQRPLHYHRDDRFFAFASMPKGLHALPDVPYAPDEERLTEFLVRMPEVGSKSFFHGVERVEPGHIVTVTANGLAKRRHWEPRRQHVELSRSDDYSDALRGLLDQAVSCRLRSTGNVGACLSGGFDSGAVVATAARLLAPSSERLIAFTCVPREGYDGPAPRHRIIDESDNAAATAALYPNVEHVVVHNEGGSPLANLDHDFFLYERPAGDLCSTGWIRSFGAAVRKREVRVLLGAGAGNCGLSYDGMELLPELFRAGRWPRLWSEAAALVASRRLRWRSVLANTFGPWCSPAVWRLALTVGGRRTLTWNDYVAINSRRLDQLDLPARAKACNHDLAMRPFKDGFELRRRVLEMSDPGNSQKGGLVDLQADCRDPTADVRLLEFCFSVPTEQFLHNGTLKALARRALSDRLPMQVLEETRGGLMVADWREDARGARDDIVEELNRLEACPVAAATLDLPRLRQFTENWPSAGWEKGEVHVHYRYALLGAIAVGHFLRRATGSNR